MERGRTPYTRSELPDSSMNLNKLPQSRPDSANSKMRVDLESNKLAQLSADNLDRPTPFWQHHFLWVKTPALSAYHTLQVRIPALIIWIALNIRRVAVEPSLLHVLIHGGLHCLFWYLSFSTINHLDEDPALWFLWLWASIFCFEFLFSIYILQSLCRRLVRKMRTGDDVSPLTLWVCLS